MNGNILRLVYRMTERDNVPKVATFDAPETEEFAIGVLREIADKLPMVKLIKPDPAEGARDLWELQFDPDECPEFFVEMSLSGDRLIRFREKPG